MINTFVLFRAIFYKPFWNVCKIGTENQKQKKKKNEKHDKCRAWKNFFSISICQWNSVLNNSIAKSVKIVFRVSLPRKYLFSANFWMHIILHQITAFVRAKLKINVTSVSGNQLCLHNKWATHSPWRGCIRPLFARNGAIKYCNIFRNVAILEFLNVKKFPAVNNTSCWKRMYSCYVESAKKHQNEFSTKTFCRFFNSNEFVWKKKFDFCLMKIWKICCFDYK